MFTLLHCRRELTPHPGVTGCCGSPTLEFLLKMWRMVSSQIFQLIIYT